MQKNSVQNVDVPIKMQNHSMQKPQTAIKCLIHVGNVVRDNICIRFPVILPRLTRLQGWGQTLTRPAPIGEKEDQRKGSDLMDYPNKYLDRRTGKILEGDQLKDYLNYEMHDSCNCFFHPHEHLLFLQFWVERGILPE